ncbi:MAG TPA: hypothetical protein PLP73_01735 [Candidatus Absconditabacterales bacterium]|nr:hypothetical protein [Candidatus Absconditabacterales bacterium]
MKTFFEIIKGFFFFLTVIVGIFFLRGQILLSPSLYEIIKVFIMPAYLIFCGVMAGYLIAHIRSQNENSTKVYTKSFIIGIIIGIILAISYMFI